MSALSIGTTVQGKPFAVPPDVVTQTTAVLGLRNSGKTNTATVIVEELLAQHHHVVVIDPLDCWWGIKSSATGKAAGFPVTVLGGSHGDLPLEERDGETLADFAVEHRAPMILSLRHLRKRAQQRFVTEFSERLYHRKGETQHRVPLLCVIDEADSFVPQRVQADEARMVGAIEDMVRRGRNAGLGLILISQRAASVNKDVLTQLELLIAHRHTSPQDRKALEEWIRAHDTEGQHDTFMASLASLAQGTAWFWSPGWLDVFQQVKVRKRMTFDSSRTPKLGQAAAAPSKLAEVDLVALRSKLAKTIEDARGNDPKELKKRIGELEAQLRKQAKAAPPPDPQLFEREIAKAVAREVAPMQQRADQYAAQLYRIHNIALEMVEASIDGGIVAPAALLFEEGRR